MTPLLKEDSWSLFCVHAFRSPSNVPSELKALTQSMAEECQALPLALKVIGGAEKPPTPGQRSNGRPWFSRPPRGGWGSSTRKSSRRPYWQNFSSEASHQVENHGRNS
ncbi:unnamed protein product [Sphagnum troendelagicum]